MIKSKINHQDAISLEYIVRSVFNECSRGGVMGIADADHLERYPLDAALVIFAPLYMNSCSICDIEDFIDRYSCIFNFDDFEYDSNVVENYIEELKQLINRYYN